MGILRDKTIDTTKAKPSDKLIKNITGSTMSIQIDGDIQLSMKGSHANFDTDKSYDIALINMSSLDKMTVTTGSRFITCSGGDLQSLSKDTATNLQFVSLQNITGSTTAPTTIFYGYCYANGVKLDENGNVIISGSVGKSGGSVKAMKDTAFTEITGYDATKTQVLKNINGTLTWVSEG